MLITKADVGKVWYLRDGTEAVITGHDEETGAYQGADCAWRPDGTVLGAQDNEEHPRDLYVRKRVPVWTVRVGGYAPMRGLYTDTEIRFASQIEAERFVRAYNLVNRDERPDGARSFLLAQGPEGQFAHEGAGVHNAERALDLIGENES